MSDSEMWDTAAETFDEAVDHGLADPVARRAWQDLILPRIGERARIADLGCGTGTLSTLLAEHGHEVVGVDFSARMIERARRKAADTGVQVDFVHADAARPPLPAAAFDVVLSRHVLWAMPDPAQALDRWVDLLRPAGTLLFVEGRWHTGAGLASTETLALLEAAGLRDVALRQLPEPELWGREITDERYLVTARV